MARSSAASATADGGVTSAFVEINPNPSRLLSSLRDSGIPNHAAVAGMVDNSVDGDSTGVRVYIEPRSGVLRFDSSRIVIADDGNGMDRAVLGEALKLGSNTSHDFVSDLGKFGMGLITDSTSMGQRLVVLTKQADGVLLVGLFDLETIFRENRFVAEIRPANADERSAWERYAVNAEHGTVVIIEKLDQLDYSHAAALINRLKKHLGQVFRQFIMAKSQKNGHFESFITINGDPVYAVDPLMLEENKEYIFPKTRELLSSYSAAVDEFTIDVSVDPAEPDGAREQIRVRVVDLPALGGDSTLAGELGINVSAQGIYVMRNQREIATAQTLGIFSRAQNLNRFRAELHVPATLDKRMGIDWTKDRVVPDQGLQELLKQKIGPHVRSVRKAYVRDKSESSTVDHKPFESLIAKKSKLLALPRARKIERGPRQNESGTVEPTQSGIQREGRSTVPQKIRDRCEFKEGHMTVSGPLWDIDTLGQKIIVTFNVDHPVWVRYVLDTAAHEGDRASIIELLHLFSYSLATAELSAFTDESMLERLINMRQQLSSNLRVLLT